MPTLEELDQKEKQLREDLYRSIKSYNKNYSDKYLDNLNLRALAQLAHPDPRENFLSRIRKLEESQI